MDEASEQIEVNGSGIDLIVGKIINDAPEVSSHIEADTALDDENPINHLDPEKPLDPAKPEKWWTGKADKYGRSFDPDIHVVNDQGEPILGKKFKTLKIKPGKVPKNLSGKTSKSIVGEIGGDPPRQPLPGSQPDQSTPIPEIDPNKSSAVQATELTYTLMRALFGAEGEPIKIENTYDEKEVLQDRYFDYFQVAGPMNIPPHWLLAGHMALMVKCRFDMPPVQKRFTRVKNWIAKKFRWLGFKSRIEKKKEKDQDA